MAGTVRLAFSLLFFLVASAVAMVDPVDFLALQAIKKSLEDLPGSKFFSKWDFTSDPCDFSGVYCLDDRVAALTLGDPAAGSPGLTGRLHPSIGTMSALTELSLVPGRVYGTIPGSLSLLHNLRFLALSRNFFSGSIPPSIAALRQLKTLDLSYNQLSGSIPGTPPAIANLILCHNHLSGRVPPIASASASLVRLDLKHNNLSGEVGPLPVTLQYLSLSYNNLFGTVDAFLPRLTSLNHLDLSVNRFSGAIPGYVFSFPLASLQLQRNLFTGPVALPEASPVSMQTVDLSYNRLVGMISPRFSSVQNLYLNNNKFTGHVPRSFVQELMDSGIQVLYLQHNFLTGIEIDPTAELPMSSSLCLQYNCMVPPVQTPCPDKAGKQKTRPSTQCTDWRG